MAGLQIYERRERALVAAADVLLTPLRWVRPRGPWPAPARILVLRLERIGDLLMAREAIADIQRAWPGTQIDLAVGSWNLPLARLIPGIHAIHIADVAWLAREQSGDRWRSLVAKARGWRRERYDLVINFEPDVRSNAIAWLAGRRRRAGYWTGGGGAFLTDALTYDPSRHVSDNARALVSHLSGRPMPSESVAPLSPGVEARDRATRSLAGASRPLIGVHVAGGRPSKQWHLSRFADTAREMSRRHGGTIVLTGAPQDRAMTAEVAAALGNVPHVDLTGALPLDDLAGLLAQLDVLITGDTGPMHLASGVGTPVVALFGPADPRRYGPRGSAHRIIRVDLPCSPCGQVRLPPERCRGRVPDCMDGIQVRVVADAASDLLARPA